jgi:hypothetical protein
MCVAVVSQVSVCMSVCVCVCVCVCVWWQGVCMPEQLLEKTATDQGDHPEWLHLWPW